MFIRSVDSFYYGNITEPQFSTIHLTNLSIMQPDPTDLGETFFCDFILTVIYVCFACLSKL